MIHVENLISFYCIGQSEIYQLENEIKIIQANVRTWLLRKNYINLRESVKILQGMWRDKKKISSNSPNVKTDKRKRSFHSDFIPDDLKSNISNVSIILSTSNQDEMYYYLNISVRTSIRMIKGKSKLHQHFKLR